MFKALGCAGVARTDFFLAPACRVLNQVKDPSFASQARIARWTEIIPPIP